MSFMFQDYRLTWFLFTHLQKIWISMWPFTLLTMCFRIWIQGGWLDLLRKKMDPTIPNNHVVKVGSRTSYPYHFFSLSSISNKDKIRIYYFCLGHPYFGLLKIMFPLLFKGIDVENFHCDVCKLTKHRWASFSN